MAQDYLGVFDTPPTRRQIRFSLTIVAALLAVLLATLPVRHHPLVQIVTFIPVLDTMMLVGELIIAALLYAQASIFRSRALTVLASVYVFEALLVIPHALSFPGAFTHDGLLGGGNVTAWTATFRRLGFPIGIALYAWLKRTDPAMRAEPTRPEARIAFGICAAAAWAAACAAMAAAGQDWLPPIFINRTQPHFVNLLLINTASILLSLAAMALLFRQRRSVLDIWLLVALSGWVIQSVLNYGAGVRYSLGWYVLIGLMMVSNLIVMLALIAESNRLYARLALSSAARQRERDARLMTMDAVTAAIAHEVGQPLTGAIANAMAGLNWLTTDEPNREKAIQALRASIDDSNRTNEVIRSIRAMFAKSIGSPALLDLNDLVRETAAALDRELAGHKVVLKLSLERTLPRIHADRAQIQRVLVNLFTNALDSLGARDDGPRRILIRSESLDGEAVRLEIADNGVGIDDDEMSHIFDPFFTTKIHGAGLGLSLCRIIAEEHGGRLWATSRKPNGAIFHLQLPLTPPA